MSEVKCSVFPSGKVSWHQWKQGAKDGDLCECGAQRLVSLTHNPESPQSKLTEVEVVLAWADKHVDDISIGWMREGWWVDTGNPELAKEYYGTLYQALHSAWSARDTTKDL